MASNVYSIYQVIDLKLLLNKKGVPYRSHNQIKKWAKRHGLDNSGERQAYLIPEELINEHNAKIKQFMTL